MTDIKGETPKTTIRLDPDMKARYRRVGRLMRFPGWQPIFRALAEESLVKAEKKLGIYGKPLTAQDYGD
jgi:hypothetical protein